MASNEVVAEHIKGFLPYLEKYDMILVLEVHGDHGTGVILKEISDLVDSPRVLVNYDTANAIFYGDVDVVKDFGDCLDKVGYVHLKEKAAGRKRSISILADRIRRDIVNPEGQLIMISHGDCAEDAAYLAKVLKEKHGVKHVHIGYVGAVIGSHAGPGVLALFFLGDHR